MQKFQGETRNLMQVIILYEIEECGPIFNEVSSSEKENFICSYKPQPSEDICAICILIQLQAAPGTERALWPSVLTPLLYHLWFAIHVNAQK